MRTNLPAVACVWRSMNVFEAERDHAYCLARATECLGVPVRAVTLDWQVVKSLGSRLRLVSRQGWRDAVPFVGVETGRKGQYLNYGLERYRLDAPGASLDLVKVVAPPCNVDASQLYDFWAVPVDQYRRLYRLVRRIERDALRVLSPIMRDADRERLWANTVGFLRQGQEQLRRYGVPRKRGVLLLGEPGNGKTLACRWLRTECDRRGLRWREVTAEEFEASRCRAEQLQQFFEIDGPGIILFDDFDAALRSREDVGPSSDRSTFLTQIDGVQAREGIVYVFTSNAKLSELDPAFRRPGRIDLVLRFPRPDGMLRRAFVETQWHPDIVRELDVPRVVAVTDGMSFAEMQELKKLLVLHHLDTGRWDWDHAWLTFQDGHAPDLAGRRIGFHTAGSSRSRLSDLAELAQPSHRSTACTDDPDRT